MSRLTLERRAEPHLALPYGQGAIALYAAASLPGPAGPFDVAKLAVHADEGTRRLGGPERVQSLHAELLELNRQLLRGSITEDSYEAELIGWLQSSIPERRPDTARLRWCENIDFGRLFPR